MKTPVHIVGGHLGSGKTTLLMAELARRNERCAVIVNDFGEAAIDATLLDGAVQITNIPGGCVCCTAPEGLAPALAAILTQSAPDRIFIEPSGLARPSDLVDMLQRGGLKERVVLQPSVVLVDATQATPDPTLLEGADMVVLSHADLADDAQLAAVRAQVSGGWPPPLRVVEARQGTVDPVVWAWPEGPRAVAFTRPVTGADSTVGHTARSWFFASDELFSWDKLRTLLAGTAGLARFKGLFRTDIGWFRLDVAGGRVTPQATHHRRDSRCDAIATDADLDSFGAALEACRISERSVAGDVLELVDPDGLIFPLPRAVLRSLPGQVPDISVVVPGRSGAGVYLRDVLRLMRAASYVATAKDGMTSAAAPVAGVGDAVLVHSLGEEPVPDAQGGPFRLYAPPGGSNCANLKGVISIRGL